MEPTMFCHIWNSVALKLRLLKAPFGSRVLKGRGGEEEFLI